MKKLNTTIIALCLSFSPLAISIDSGTTNQLKPLMDKIFRNIKGTPYFYIDFASVELTHGLCLSFEVCKDSDTSFLFGAGYEFSDRWALEAATGHMSFESYDPFFRRLLNASDIVGTLDINLFQISAIGMYPLSSPEGMILYGRLGLVSAESIGVEQYRLLGSPTISAVMKNKSVAKINRPFYAIGFAYLYAVNYSIGLDLSNFDAGSLWADTGTINIQSLAIRLKFLWP